MIFNYKLYKFNYPFLNYKYIIQIYNDILELDIDLKKYPNYIFLKNQDLTNKYYYKVIKILNEKKNINNKTIGDILLIDIKDYITNKQMSTYVIKDGLYFKKCTQTEFDKYFYILNIKNDNSKLFNHIYKYIILFYKEKFLENKKKILKNSTKFTINNKIYTESLI